MYMFYACGLRDRSSVQYRFDNGSRWLLRIECPDTVARIALVLVMMLCVYNFLDASLLNIEDMLYKKSGVQQD